MRLGPGNRLEGVGLGRPEPKRRGYRRAPLLRMQYTREVDRDSIAPDSPGALHYDLFPALVGLQARAQQVRLGENGDTGMMYYPPKRVVAVIRHLGKEAFVDCEWN